MLVRVAPLPSHNQNITSRLTATNQSIKQAQLATTNQGHGTTNRGVRRARRFQLSRAEDSERRAAPRPRQKKPSSARPAATAAVWPGMREDPRVEATSRPWVAKRGSAAHRKRSRGSCLASFKRARRLLAGTSKVSFDYLHAAAEGRIARGVSSARPAAATLFRLEASNMRVWHSAICLSLSTLRSATRKS